MINFNIFIIITTCIFSLSANCSGPIHANSAKEVISFFHNQKKKVITFIGYSGAGYEKPEELQLYVKNLLSSFSSKEYIINIGVTPDGIGQIYKLAKGMGFATTGIVSSKAKKYLKTIEYADTAFLIEDQIWGGYIDQGKTLSPTSEAMISVSNIIIGIGGGPVSFDELSEAYKRNIPLTFIPAEMNHNKAIKKAKKKNRPIPTNFYGKANSIINVLNDRDQQKAL